MGKFVVAVNARGVKQVIPAHWLDHVTLGRAFRRPRSRHVRPPVEVESAPEQG